MATIFNTLGTNHHRHAAPGGDAASLDGEHVAFGRGVDGRDALVALGGVAVDDEDAQADAIDGQVRASKGMF